MGYVVNWGNPGLNFFYLLFLFSCSIFFKIMELRFCVCVYVCMYVCLSLSHVWLFTAPWTLAHQALLSMDFSRQEYWSGLPFPSPGFLPRDQTHISCIGRLILLLLSHLGSLPWAWVRPYGPVLSKGMLGKWCLPLPGPGHPAHLLYLSSLFQTHWSWIWWWPSS